ncbi:MAG: TIGR04086 family membrane protein [Lachnospiraceae bacterium]
MAKERKKKDLRSFGGFLRALLASYLVSTLVLLILAFILYKWGLSENIMMAGTIITYVLSGFVGGVFLGKSGRNRAFLWGLLLGTVYYMLLLLAALLLPVKETNSGITTLINLGICMLAGMTGAMVVKK